MIPILRDDPAVLNINFPPLDNPREFAGLEVVETGRRLTPLTVHSVADEDDKHWFDYRSMRGKKEVTPDSDIDLAYRGFITVTPLTLDIVDRARLPSFRNLLNPE